MYARKDWTIRKILSSRFSNDFPNTGVMGIDACVPINKEQA
jgi:hypothetical protein